jgi:hypothetical protein
VQAVQFAWLKEDYPDIYAQVKHWASKGPCRTAVHALSRIALRVLSRDTTAALAPRLALYAAVLVV